MLFSDKPLMAIQTKRRGKQTFLKTKHTTIFLFLKGETMGSNRYFLTWLPKEISKKLELIICLRLQTFKYIPHFPGWIFFLILFSFASKGKTPQVRLVSIHHSCLSLCHPCRSHSGQAILHRISDLFILYPIFIVFINNSRQRT